jgi:tetratricopeptide (TPR) repeat protein
MQLRRAVFAFAVAAALGSSGCAESHVEKTARVRSALDEGRPDAALVALNEHLGVASAKDLPATMAGDIPVFLLDRGSVLQSTARFDLSKRDLEAADKAIEILDFESGAADTIAEYVFSGSSAKYQAPPYEKLLIHTLNMLNYLETKDVSGALVEARRLAVMVRYFEERLHDDASPILGLGGFLAGYAYEKAGDADEALRYYDRALKFAGRATLGPAVRELLGRGTYSSPRLREAADLGASAAATAPADAAAEPFAELLLVLGYGRVPHKIPQRIPIGAALSVYSFYLSPRESQLARDLFAQGLVTWINFPSLGPEQGGYETPTAQIDGQWVQLEELVDVSAAVRQQWKRIEGRIVASAITRLATRVLLGQAARAAAGSGGNDWAGLFASLAVQGVLTAMDNPDTRSWETLPARVVVARARVAPGRHVVDLQARGARRTETVNLVAGGWRAVSLMALR